MKIINRIIFAVIMVLSLGLYVYTLAPGWGASNIFNTWDGLEYLLCSQLFGIDHPPGHPLYLIAAKIFSLIVPVGSVAYRMNLFSAVFASLTVAFVYLVIELFLRTIGRPKDDVLRNIAAIAGACTFAVSKVFWAHSSIIKAYTMYLFLMAVLFYLILKYLEKNERKLFYFIGLTLGLMVSVNILNAFSVALPVVIFLFAFDIISGKFSLRLFDWIRAFIVFCIGTFFYAYYFVASRIGPGFIHPMNLMVKDAVGTVPWFLWFISGKAWTGEGMFSPGRILLNVPNYLRHLTENFSLVSLLLFAFACAFGLFKIFRELNFKDIPGSLNKISTGAKAFMMLFLAFAFVVLPQLALEDVSNPGSTTYIYVANFFLPSFLIFALLAGIGLGISLDLLFKYDIPSKLVRMVSGKKQVSARALKAIYLIIFYCVIILPVYFLSVNFAFCNLRDENTAYDFAKSIISSLPERSVVMSKLVFQSIGAYFDTIEPIAAGKTIIYENPDIIGKDIPQGGLPMLEQMSVKTIMLEKMISSYLNKGYKVFISGDSVDQDKAPEVLLISDLELLPAVPEGLLSAVTKPFPTELIPYEVKGFIAASAFHGTPKIESPGVSNDGDFASTLKLLGYSTLKNDEWKVGRNRMALEFYWKVLSEPQDDLMGILTVFDARLQRIDPFRSSWFFRLGGVNPSSKWRTGDVMREKAYFYLPALPYGEYYLALGLLKKDGGTLPYYPAAYKENGRTFDFILVLPFGIGEPSQVPPGGVR